MTREKIEELRGIKLGWCVCAPESGCSAARAQQSWPALLAAAERALLLEDVLAAARDVLSDLDDAWMFGSNITKLRAAIERAEGTKP